MNHVHKCGTTLSIVGFSFNQFEAVRPGKTEPLPTNSYALYPCSSSCKISADPIQPTITVIARRHEYVASSSLYFTLTVRGRNVACICATRIHAIGDRSGTAAVREQLFSMSWTRRRQRR